MKSIPVIDLFAGPGGLGEGFSVLKKNNRKFFRKYFLTEGGTVIFDKKILYLKVTRLLSRDFLSLPFDNAYAYSTTTFRSDSTAASDVVNTK